ncbi:MAG: aminotransferase class I/II-fold pyridoxal phosphate-dependent enzyme [Phycisphaerales bacterium]|nr:aminotransferase class I/II-fold pyridoxal phosphate-dependent enzyme [Phycisphaerales bacterium]MCI0629084.1 aminotransferase class I/II-fold pyridoxal phosphate-dependent enzyme [Phycisphaerales bacterium]MCI0675618.1 aminotransferase class I/II-fold pyridoxal phosphate-dependent enzyme [Phycisphaerales bacterium]
MTTTTSRQSGIEVFEERSAAIIKQLEQSGQLKTLQMIEGPMDANVRVRGYGEVVCFCSNNYLGLANHPEVNAAGIEGIKKYGAGTASVRFIGGTFTPHETIEKTLAKFYGVEAAYTFTSCWNANEAIFPTLCEPGDLVISDELNHASIIDSIRLMTTIKKGVHKAVFKHSDLGVLRSVLEASRANPEVTGAIWVVTDGVFSMEGDIADLPGLRKLCDEFGALLVVDDSHGTGVMGKTGRGTHEHFGMKRSQIDFITGTLGKALGGAAGGYVAGPRNGIELLIQRGRPTLFSNALPVSVACSANKAIELLMQEPKAGRVVRLRENVAYARAEIKKAGFDVLESPTAICPIIVHDTARAIAMSKKLLELGVYVIGFGYPVVPEGHARLRVQISAAHAREHVDKLVSALKTLKKV